MKIRQSHVLLILLSGLLILQSCGTMHWDNFNKKKHLKLKSKEVYHEQESTDEEVVSEEVYDWEEESTEDGNEVLLIEESFVLEELEEEVDDSYSYAAIPAVDDSTITDDPDRAEKVKQAKIKETRKNLLKAHKWNWITFVPFVIFLALIGILYFVVNLTNPVAEILYVLSIFAGLTLILGFVSSARTIGHARNLRKISEDEDDLKLVKQMINRSVFMMILYILFPAMLATGLYLFGS